MEFVHSALENGRDLYLLLDGALMDAPRFVYTHDDSPGFDQLYRGTPHEVVREVSPCIVKPSGTTRLWEVVPEWQSIGLVIEACGDIRTVGNHLRSLISVKLPDGTFAYLRFYSPAQIAALFSALSPAEASSFSGPVRKWHYFAPGHGWKTIEVPAVGPHRDPGDEGWFQLTREHISAIDAHQEAMFIEGLVRQVALPITPGNLSLMEQRVAQGRARGFRTQDQLANYTEMAVHHDNRLQKPDALAILNDTKRPARERLADIERLIAYGDA